MNSRPMNSDRFDATVIAGWTDTQSGMTYAPDREFFAMWTAERG